MKETCLNCYHLLVPLSADGVYRCKIDLQIVADKQTCEKWEQQFIAKNKKEIKK